MTETQSQRIHDIIYSNDSREELGERIVALEDENARLRSCLSDDAENARLIMAENAKLRELCTEMLWSMKGAHGYYKGEVHAALMTRSIHDGKPDPTVEISLSLAEEVYEDRMRELGVEES